MKTKEEALKKCVENEREKYYQQLFEEEGISKEDLDMVDLDIGFSPVLPFRGDKYPAEVIETIGGDYIVHGHPFNPVSAEMLKVMRYRYLSNRKNPFAE